MNQNLREVIAYFFRLGFVAFGGPAAHIAMMEEDLVGKKKWLSTKEFLDYMGITNIIPGPNSTEMTMHCGYHRAGFKGLMAAGSCFILPAVTMTLIIAVFFEKYSEIEWLIPILDAVKASVISFIVAAVIKLGNKAVSSIYLFVLGVIVIILSFLGINEILCILGAGIANMVVKSISTGQKLNSLALLPAFILLKVPYSHFKLFLIFLKIGAVLFGSGYVLFAYLDGELIDNTEWLTHPDLVEAIAVGQLTPGPVLSTATFIGYKIGGLQGALLATLGIFLPSFFYVWLLNRFLHKIKESKVLGYFLEAVNVAAVAVMLAVTFKMTSTVILDWKTAAICVASLVVYFIVKNITPLWIIGGAAIAGFLLSFV